MKRGERELLREALLEAVTEYRADPTEERRFFLTGVRYAAVLLGMPEGRSTFTWPELEQPAPATPPRGARRDSLLRSTAASVMEFNEGDEVAKIKGYRFVGTVVAAFYKTTGERRIVVENADGLLHIFNDSQFAPARLEFPSHRPPTRGQTDG